MTLGSPLGFSTSAPLGRMWAYLSWIDSRLALSSSVLPKPLGAMAIVVPLLSALRKDLISGLGWSRLDAKLRMSSASISLASMIHACIDATTALHFPTQPCRKHSAHNGASVDAARKREHSGPSLKYNAVGGAPCNRSTSP